MVSSLNFLTRGSLLSRFGIISWLWRFNGLLDLASLARTSATAVAEAAHTEGQVKEDAKE